MSCLFNILYPVYYYYPVYFCWNGIKLVKFWFILFLPLPLAMLCVYVVLCSEGLGWERNVFVFSILISVCCLVSFFNYIKNVDFSFAFKKSVIWNDFILWNKDFYFQIKIFKHGVILKSPCYEKQNSKSDDCPETLSHLM